MDTVQASTASASASAHPGTAGGEFISFRVGAEDYGISTLDVQEIRSYEVPTRIAQAPAWLSGVIDLRGTIVPIVDMRIQLGCADTACSSTTIVMVLNLEGRTVGVLVDAVTEVLQLATDEICPAPPLGFGSLAGESVIGMSTVEGRLLVLMDMARWLHGSGMGRH